ncbi:cysteine peptidase family C39 domain-containing protein, partial [Streptococcus sobrinus]
MKQALYIAAIVGLVILVNILIEVIKRVMRRGASASNGSASGRVSFGSRYKLVIQVDTRDCGPAALTSVAKHYGSDYSLAKLRELSKTDKQGTTALGLVEAAKAIDFETRSIKADMTLFDYTDLTYPF